MEPVARSPELIRQLGLLELAQVEAGTEDVTGARDDDGLHRLLAAQVVERARQLVTKSDGQRVLLLCPVERQRHDAVVRRRSQHQPVAHRRWRR